MSGPLDTVTRVVEEGGDADDVLRAVVDSVGTDPDVAWVGIAFAEGDTLVLGPARGDPDEERRERIPIAYDGAVVGELWADGAIRREELERVAAVIAPYVLIGWDTGGETWEP